MGNVTVDKRIRIFPNQKPWMTSQVGCSSRTATLPSGRATQKLYSAARANLKRGITKAKQDYKTKIEDHLSNHNPRQMWQGIQEITNFRGQNNTAVDSSDQLAEELNTFFARFEIPTLQSAATPPQPQPQPPPSFHTLTLQAQDVNRELAKSTQESRWDQTGFLGKYSEPVRISSHRSSPPFSISPWHNPPYQPALSLLPSSPSQENTHVQPQRLPPHRTDTHHHKVPGAAGPQRYPSLSPPSFDPHQFA